MPPEPMLTQEDRTWAMASHLLSLLNLLTVAGGLIAVLILWLARRERSPFIEESGRESLNFQITMLLAAAVGGVLTLILVGFVVLGVVMIASFILPILAGLAASEGRRYRYPFTLRLIPSPLPIPPPPPEP
jgi:uncharacterized Tic20 family protein